MTLKEAMGKVMVLLDEVTSHNLTQNMEEYEYKIYPLFDSVQRELAALCKPLEGEVTLEAAEGRLQLPAACYEALELWQAGKRVSFITWGRELKRPDGTPWAAGAYRLRCHLYPETITKDTEAGYRFEIEEDAQEVMLYGVCAGLCINDEPELYNTYLDRYNAGMSNILQRKAQRPEMMVKGGIRL